MSERGPSNDELFRFFVLQQQQTAMIFMGKLVHPETGKTERNLEWARMAIDLLGMMEEKTRGNLRPEDERMLGSVLTTLRLNYVEESKRPDPDSEPSAESRDGSASEPSHDSESAKGTGPTHEEGTAKTSSEEDEAASPAPETQTKE